MRAFGLVSVVLALGVGYFVVQRSATSGAGQAPPQQQVDVVSVRQHLLTVGQAERQYLVTHSTYATLEQLAAEDLLPGGTEFRGYTLTTTSADADGFTITATPTDPDKARWPVFEVDESLQVTGQ